MRDRCTQRFLKSRLQAEEMKHTFHSMQCSWCLQGGSATGRATASSCQNVLGTWVAHQGSAVLGSKIANSSCTAVHLPHSTCSKAVRWKSSAEYFLQTNVHTPVQAIIPRFIEAEAMYPAGNLSITGMYSACAPEAYAESCEESLDGTLYREQCCKNGTYLLLAEFYGYAHKQVLNAQCKLWLTLDAWAY